jgi:hypothetical protein
MTPAAATNHRLSSPYGASSLQVSVTPKMHLCPLKVTILLSSLGAQPVLQARSCYPIKRVKLTVKSRIRRLFQCAHTGNRDEDPSCLKNPKVRLELNRGLRICSCKQAQSRCSPPSLVHPCLGFCLILQGGLASC